MKGLIVAALALAALAVSSVAFAGATKTVSGQLTGTAEWDQIVRASTWHVHGTYTSDGLGSGTYEGTLTTNHEVLDASVEDPPGCFETFFVPCGSPEFVVTGAITFTSTNGASITGTVGPGSWVVENDTFHVVDYGFGLNLQLGDGTKRFKHVTGSLSLSYDSGVQLGGIGCGADCGKIFDGGTFTGTIEH